MRLPADQSLCYVHRNETGKFFCAIGDCHPAGAEETDTDFLQSLSPSVRRLRLLGIPDNAEFIVRCHRLRPDLIVEVGSPQACPDPGELVSAKVVIQRMRQYHRSPSLGGFHRTTPLDLAAYRLVRFALLDQGPSPRVLQATREHPAFYDLTFIPTLDVAAVGAVLCAVLDFRWHVDPRHPDRLGRLQVAMGLTPRIQTEVSAGLCRNAAAHRCAAVLRAWKGTGNVDLGHPGNFLWRRRLSVGDDAKGDLSGSQGFIAYLVRTWQQEVARKTMPHLRESLFVPERILRNIDVDEITAYQEFAERRPA